MKKVALLLALYFSVACCSSCSKESTPYSLEHKIDEAIRISDYGKRFYCIELDGGEWDDYVDLLADAAEANDSKEFDDIWESMGEQFDGMREHIDELERALDEIRSLLKSR